MKVAPLKMKGAIMIKKHTTALAGAEKLFPFGAAQCATYVTAGKRREIDSPP